jgi:hypothetical protein
MGICRYRSSIILNILTIYRYILRTCTVEHLLYFESGFSCLAAPTDLCRTLLACFARCYLPLECLLNTQTTQAGLARLARKKTSQPQVNLVDIAAPPSVGSCCVSTAIREAWILALADHVMDRWSRVCSQKKEIRGTVPNMLAAGAT